ncbi:MAG: penicillin acylase family protein [Acidobacteria bacterium]|nr:penicillin acylase family protein [Acidobacteriota bacterium]
MGRILRIVNLGVAVLLLAASALIYWYAWRPLPVTSGTLRLPVGHAAKAVRDERGVAHIEAASIEDIFFLQGYITSQDRLWQMDALRRLAAGELSEIVGPAALESDQEARRLRLGRLADEQAASLDAADRRLFNAYARGVNHFLETHRSNLPLEFTLLGYDPRPWTVADSVLAGLQMFRTLSTTWKDEVLKQGFLAKGDPRKVSFLFPVRTGGEVQPGSNAWVLSGKLTATGKPILANDTHLEWAFPGPWYAVHLTAPELNVTGFSLPGLPSVIIGHNQRIAWGITNLHYDVQDLYLEQFDPQTGRYLYKDHPEQARLERETIRIKGRPPIELAVWTTRHGPVFLRAGQQHYALRWVASEPGFRFPFLAIDQAKNWSDFAAALARFTGPASNFVYADIDGNIGYHAAGKLPVRRTYDGDIPSDGNKGNDEWDGFIPFDQLPAAYNPPSGMLVTANQNPFGDSYPYRVNGNFSTHYRSRQIEARLKSKTGWKPEEMPAVQTDLYSAFSHWLAGQALRAYQARGLRNPALDPAAKLIEAWDGQMRQRTAAPLLATLIFQHLRRAAAEKAAPGQGAAYEAQMAPAVLEKLLTARPKDWFDDYDQLLLRVFVDAVEEGRRLQGHDVSKWDYGRYTELTLVHPILGRLPYIGGLFNIGPVPMSGSATTVKQTTRRLGPSMRFVADSSNWENSLFSVTIGQSGQPFSKHFRDQWQAYYEGRCFAMPFARVEAKSVLEIQPGR